MALDVTVGVKNAGFKTGLEQMRAQAGRWTGDLKGMVAGAFSIAGVVAFAGRMREVRNEALRLGTSVESVQRISKVAKGADVDFEGLAKAMNKVTLEAGKAASGDKASGTLFKRLGLDARAFMQLPMEGKLVALSAAFERSRGSGDATAAMLELLGERGTQIIPLLAQGPKALTKSMSEAEVQTKATVLAFASLEKTIARLKGTGARWLGSAIGAWRTVVAHVGAEMNQGKYDAAAAVDLDQEKTRRKKAHEKPMTDEEEQGFLSTRAEELKAKDVQATVNEADADEPEQKPADDFDAQRANAEKIAELRKSIAEEEAKNRADALIGEQHINELLGQRAQLEGQINENTLAGLEAKKRALALDHEITAARRQFNANVKRAEEGEVNELEKQYLAKATPAQQKSYLQGKRQRLMDEADEAERKGDTPKVYEKRTQAEALDPEIEQAGKKRQNVTVAVDSLQRVGGGGTIGAAPDQAVRQREKANQLLQEIKGLLARTSVDTRDNPEAY